MSGLGTAALDRRSFLGTLGLLAAPRGAGAQPTDKIYRIGYLGFASRAPFHQILERALAERGWVAGKNLIIAYRFAEEKHDRLPDLAAELVRLEPEVIVAGPTASVRAVKSATTKIPIVMSGVADPVGEGLIASFARPGANVTGVTGSLAWPTYAKQVPLLKDALVSARRIAWLRDPANRASRPGGRALTEAAKSLGIELQVLGAGGPGEFDRAFRAMTQARAEALIIHREAAFVRYLGRLGDLSAKHRLPSVCGHRGYAEAGGLMSFSVDPADEIQHIANYVDRLLRGAEPADLPVEQPSKVELIINLRVAKALGLTVPPSLLQRADQVIQ